MSSGDIYCLMGVMGGEDVVSMLCVFCVVHNVSGEQWPWNVEEDVRSGAQHHVSRFLSIATPTNSSAGKMRRGCPSVYRMY